MKFGSWLAKGPFIPDFAGRPTKTCPETTQEVGGIRKAKRKSDLCDGSSGDICSRQLSERCVQPPVPDHARDAAILCKRSIKMSPGDVEAPKNEVWTKLVIGDVAVDEIQHPLAQGGAQRSEIPGAEIPGAVRPLPAQRRGEYRYQRLLHCGGLVG